MSDKLTVGKIKRIIAEEKKKLQDQGLIASDAVEDAWSGGKNLVHKIDYIKKLGIKEQKHRKKAEIYAKLKNRLRKSVLKEI